MLQLNLYAYAANNPVTFVDPEGRVTIVAGATIGRTIGGPPGFVIGAITGIIVRTVIGEVIWDY